MLDLPSALMGVIVRFAPLFSNRVFKHAQVLVIGALLSPGRRRSSSSRRRRRRR